MKSREIFPIEDRNDTINTNVSEIVVCHKNKLVSREFYISNSQYCKAIEALEIAESEIEELRNQLNLNSSAVKINIK